MEYLTDFFAQMNWIESIGWGATLTTILAYSVNTMIPLRILAILSSVLFLIYGIIMQVGPLIVMEVILLPINIFRYWQLVSLRSKLKKSLAEERTDFSVIKTYGKRLRFEAGDFVFRKGDAVDNLYYVDKGHVQIGNDKTLKSGDVFGEFGFFSDAGVRSASVQCLKQVEVYVIDEKRFMRLQFEDPSFGLAIMRTITRRLMRDLQEATDAGVTVKPYK